jgi:pimeloyl-ACP methyl ester carboxylesterase
MPALPKQKAVQGTLPDTALGGLACSPAWHTGRQSAHARDREVALKLRHFITYIQSILWVSFPSARPNEACRSMQPEIRYAKSGDVHIAYQVFGAGSLDLVYIPGFISNIETYWEWPEFAAWLHHLGTRARVIIFDKRGTGLSDRLGGLPNLDQRMDDARAVMDAVGSKRAAIIGLSEGGSLATLFAATYPERCSALILYGAFARFSDWFPTKQKFDAFIRYIDTSWGSGTSFVSFAPSKKGNIDFQRWWGRWERQGGSPSAVQSLMRMNSEINIAGILPSVRVPAPD